MSVNFPLRLLLAAMLAFASHAAAASSHADPYADVLDLHGTPANAADRSFNVFFDAGAWHGADCIIVIDEKRTRTFDVLRSQFDSVEEINDPRVAKLDKDFVLAIGRGLREPPKTLQTARAR